MKKVTKFEWYVIPFSSCPDGPQEVLNKIADSLGKLTCYKVCALNTEGRTIFTGYAKTLDGGSFKEVFEKWAAQFIDKDLL